MTVARSSLDGIATPREVALFLGLFVAAIGASVLAGWLLDVSVLRSALPFGVPMRANVALGMLMCGLALALLSLGNPAKLGPLFAATVGVLVTVLGALTLSQDLFGWDLGIDQWLVRDTTGTTRFAVPGRMSPPTAFCFLLIGTGLLVATRRRQAQFRKPVLLALGAMVILVGALALLGQTSERLLEIRFLSYSRIASYSALGFTLLGCGLIALARSEGRLAWSLDAVTTGGFVAGLTAMVLTAGISYQFTSQLRNDAVQVSHTQEVLKELQEFNTFLADFTISAGRYIITRDERTLDGREKTKEEIRVDLEELRKLTADSPDQLKRLDQIGRLHAQRITMSDEIIAKFRQRILAGNLPSAGEASPLGKEYPALGVEIEGLIKAMEADEYARLERRQKRAEATSRETFLVLPLGVLVAMMLLALGLFFLNQAAGARAHAHARLSVLHEIDLAIIGAKTPAQIAEAALPRLRDLLGLPRVAVNMFDLAKGEAEWLVSVGRHRTHVGPGIRFSMELMGDPERLKRGEMQLIEVGALTQRGEAEALLSSDVRWYIVVPMIVRGELIGGLSFGGPSREFPPEQTEIAREVAAQLAIAIAQTRLDERAKRADAQYRLVFENVPVGISMTGADGTVTSTNPVMVRMLGYSTVEEVIAVLGEHVNTAYIDPEARKTYARTLLRDGVVRNFEVQLRRRDGSQFWASVDGKRIVDTQGGTSQFVNIVDDITERKQAENRILRLNRVYAVLSGINTLIVRVRDRDELFREACRIAVDHGKFHVAWIGVVNRELGRVDLAAHCGGTPDFLEILRRRDWLGADESGNRPAVGQVLIEKKALFSNDIQTDPQIRYTNDHMAQGTRSLAVLPLMVADSVTAVLCLHARETGFFDDDEKRLLLELAGDISFALDGIKKAEQLDYLAYFDSVTGLANRTLFHERLGQSLATAGREGRNLALIILDIERFKTINDTLGRQAGDTLLKQIADRMAGNARDIAWLARIGADHFAIMAPDIQNVDDLARLTEQRLEKFFGPPFRIGETELRIAAKLGIAVFPGDGSDAETLFRNAEAALKKAKASGDRYLFYTQAMNERVAEKLVLETKLRQALERDEFVLHYQPKVELETRRIVGVEALIRWQSPELGLVPPMKFISLLEETGLILPVGTWALKRASLDHRKWVDQGLKAPRVAVNVSPIQLRQRDFVSIVEQAIIEGVAPTGIDLEITESLIMEDIQGNIEKLKSIRGLGVTIAIDDFGTGYSSLGYLAKLPVQTLKIDRSFIITMLKDAGAMTLVQTMISLAHSLKLKVVAEGVDAEDQAKTLRLLRCDEMQGYLFSRPIPFDQMTTLLEKAKAA